jgi:hypothetical protein
VTTGPAIRGHDGAAVATVTPRWARLRDTSLALATLVMVVAAGQRLVAGLRCYATDAGCGIDIRRFHGRVWSWFAEVHRRRVVHAGLHTALGQVGAERVARSAPHDVEVEHVRGSRIPSERGDAGVGEQRRVP